MRIEEYLVLFNKSVHITLITMTMGDELPVTSLVLPVLIRPVLTQVRENLLVLRRSYCIHQLLQNILFFYIIFT